MWFNRSTIVECFTLIYILANLHVGKCEKPLKRQKRLAYPRNSCTGVLVAIAIPLGLENRNVFVSWNFEANYNMPTTAQELIPGPLTRLELVDRRSMGAETGESPSPVNGTIIKRSTVDDDDRVQLISRENLYKFIIKKLNSYNLDGKACLLRSICEVAHEPLHEHNGLVGDLLGVILTPSTTKNQGLHRKYYEAESLGRKGDCGVFSQACNVNILSLFTNSE